MSHNEGPREWQNMFALTKFCCIEVLYHIILLLLGRRISFVIPRTSVHIEVYKIEVPLYNKLVS